MWKGSRNAAGQFVKQNSQKQTYREIHQRWRNKAKLTPEGRAIIMLFKARQRAKAKGYAVTITKEWVAERVRRGVCAYTGIRFVLDGGTAHKYAPSLDQITPGGGYTPENTRVVVWMFNQARSNYSDQELLDFAFLLVKKHFDSITFDDDYDDLDTVTVASDDNDEYWNQASQVMTGVACIQ
jgi:hypothetical protein